MISLWRWLFLRRPAETVYPQGDWDHWRVAFRGSLGLALIGGIALWLMYARNQGAKWESYT